MLAAISQISDRIFLFIFNNIFTKGIMKMVQKRLMEIIQIGSDKGENDNAVIPSEGWDNTPLGMSKHIQKAGPQKYARESHDIAR